MSSVITLQIKDEAVYFSSLLWLQIIETKIKLAKQKKSNGPFNYKVQGWKLAPDMAQSKRTKNIIYMQLMLANLSDGLYY